MPLGIEGGGEERIPGLKKVLYEQEGTNTIEFSRLGRRMI
jgi:hypothetical protein